jgi:hypothetical protein
MSVNASSENPDEDESTLAKLAHTYKVRFILTVFLVIGFLIHFAVSDVIVGDELWGVSTEFYAKAADAIIIAAIVGITYEWYAQKLRARGLEDLIERAIAELQDEDQLSQSEVKAALSEIFSNDQIASFSVFERDEGTDYVSNKIKNSKENVKVIGEFRTGMSSFVDDIHETYHDTKIERLKIDRDIEFQHACPSRQGDGEWLEKQIELFEAAENPGSKYALYHFDSYPPHIAIIIIDSSLLIIDLKQNRPGYVRHDTELVLATHHEEIVSAFNNYSQSIFDEIKAVAEPDPLKDALESAHM